MKRLLYGISVVCLVSLGSPLAHARFDCPAEIDNAHECTQFLEKRLLDQYPQLFQRDGATLVMRSPTGERIELVDTVLNNDERNSADASYYSLAEYFPDVGYALISVSFYEGGNYLLFNLDTGKKIVIGGEAALSPDKKRFVVYYGDIESGYSANTLAVYRIDGPRLNAEYEVHPEDWGVNKAVWKTNDLIEYSKIHWLNGEIKESKYRLRMSAGTLPSAPTWTSDEPVTAKPPTTKANEPTQVAPASSDREEAISAKTLLVSGALAVVALLLAVRVRRR